MSAGEHERIGREAADEQPPVSDDEEERAENGHADDDEETGAAEQSSPRSGRRYRKRRGRPAKARGQPNSSDAASARWTIRGVPPHIRDIALKAAESRNMTVGDWVAEAIIGYARGKSQPQVDAPEPIRNVPATESPPDLVSMIQRLDDRMTRIEQWQHKGFFGRVFGRPRVSS